MLKMDFIMDSGVVKCATSMFSAHCSIKTAIEIRVAS